jgi:hypothetical protein
LLADDSEVERSIQQTATPPHDPHDDDGEYKRSDSDDECAHGAPKIRPTSFGRKNISTRRHASAHERTTDDDIALTGSVFIVR